MVWDIAYQEREALGITGFVIVLASTENNIELITDVFAQIEPNLKSCLAH